MYIEAELDQRYGSDGIDRQGSRPRGSHGVEVVEEEEVAAAAAENRAGTLTEPLRMSERNVHRPNYAELDGGREDDSKSDSDDESRATRCCMVSTDKGNNGTVSKAVSSADPPRRMKRKATAMWSRSSSSCDNVNDEAQGTERGLSEAEEEEVAAAAAAENGRGR